MIKNSGEVDLTGIMKSRLRPRPKNVGRFLTEDKIWSEETWSGEDIQKELNRSVGYNDLLPEEQKKIGLAMLDPSNSQSKIIDLCIKYDDKLCFFSNPFQIKRKIIMDLCEGCKFLNRNVRLLRGTGLLLGKKDRYDDDGGLTYG